MGKYTFYDTLCGEILTEMVSTEHLRRFAKEIENKISQN